MTKKQKTAVPAEDVLLHVALLDDADIYLEMVDVKQSALTDRHLPEITSCDLPPGVCKWDRKAKTFNYIKRPPKNAPPVDAVRVIALLAEAVAKSGVALPAEVQSWLKGYFKDFDDLQNMDKGR